MNIKQRIAHYFELTAARKPKPVVKDDKYFYKTKEARLIGKEGRLKVIELLSYEAAKFFVKEAAKYLHQSFTWPILHSKENFMEYSEGLYLLYTGEHVFILHFDEAELYDAKDNLLNYREFISAYPGFSNILGKEAIKHQSLMFADTADKKAVENLLKMRGANIQYLADPSEKQQMLSVSPPNVLTNIQYIEQPAQAVQNYVIDKNPALISIIKNSSEESQLRVIEADYKLFLLIKKPCRAAIDLAARLKNDVQTKMYIKRMADDDAKYKAKQEADKAVKIKKGVTTLTVRKGK